MNYNYSIYEHFDRKCWIKRKKFIELEEFEKVYSKIKPWLKKRMEKIRNDFFQRVKDSGLRRFYGVNNRDDYITVYKLGYYNPDKLDYFSPNKPIFLPEDHHIEFLQKDYIEQNKVPDFIKGELRNDLHKLAKEKDKKIQKYYNLISVYDDFFNYILTHNLYLRKDNQITEYYSININGNSYLISKLQNHDWKVLKLTEVTRLSIQDIINQTS